MAEHRTDPNAEQPGATASPKSKAELEREQKAADEAAELQAAQQAAAREAETAGVEDASPEVVEGPSRRKFETCPVKGCSERCEVYQGENPHKLGTMTCPTHGRMPVKD